MGGLVGGQHVRSAIAQVMCDFGSLTPSSVMVLWTERSRSSSSALVAAAKRLDESRCARVSVIKVSVSQLALRKKLAIDKCFSNETEEELTSDEAQN